jgi:signal transduction histidine kinase
MELNYLLRVLYDMPQDEVVTVKGLIQILEDALDIEEEERLKRAIDERIDLS